MSFQSDVRDEVEALIAASVPGGVAVVGTNIFNWIPAARMNLLERLKNSQVVLPIWIFDVSEFNADDQWGVAARSYRCPLMIVEIRQQKNDDAQETMMGNLNLIRHAIESDSNSYFQAVEYGQITAGASDENLAPLIEAQLDIVAATLRYDPGVLCGENL